MLVLLLLFASAVLTSGDGSLAPGKYCHLQPTQVDDRGLVPDIYYAFLYFEYESPSRSELAYNHLDYNWFKIEYDDVTFEDNQVVLRRRNSTEGPELYPYFKVGFNLTVPSGKSDVLLMVAKDGTYSHELTTQACTAKPKFRARCFTKSQKRSLSARDLNKPFGQYAGKSKSNSIDLYTGFLSSSNQVAEAVFSDADPSTFEYHTGLTGWKLDEEESRKVLKLEGGWEDESKQFMEIQADLIFNSVNDSVLFIPHGEPLSSAVDDSKMITLSSVPLTDIF
ncbi:hypothetical protein FOZ60_008366 [Perkinsus olseni]|uniref:Uncharacterized protein n=1 Tax=Perkinsus olseni TaxID=32597 RepID=A0A7J6NKG6_PEROL|nr:hypothetical protein FOZ60_008366 [Perkinsus olseni]